MKNNKGFTLIELLVTIGLIGLIGSVVAINMVGLSQKQEKKEIDRIENIVEAALEVCVSKEGTSNCNNIDNLKNNHYLKSSVVNGYTCNDFIININEDTYDVTCSKN